MYTFAQNEWKVEIYFMKEEKLILSPKSQKGDDGYKVFSIRIKEDTVSRLEYYSKELQYSRNELVNKLLEYSLDHIEIKR